MNAKRLVNDLYYAGRHYTAGTTIKPVTEPASGGYFFAEVEYEGRIYVVSIRESDVEEVEKVRMNATEKRFAAMNAINRVVYDNESNCFRPLIHNDPAKVGEAIRSLKMYGRTEEWLDNVETWATMVETHEDREWAYHQFAIFTGYAAL